MRRHDWASQTILSCRPPKHWYSDFSQQDPACRSKALMPGNVRNISAVLETSLSGTLRGEWEINCRLTQDFKGNLLSPFVGPISSGWPSKMGDVWLLHITYLIHKRMSVWTFDLCKAWHRHVGTQPKVCGCLRLLIGYLRRSTKSNL